MRPKQIFLASVTQQHIHFLVLTEKKEKFILEHASQISLLSEKGDFSHFSDDKVQKEIRTHLSTFPHPKKIHLILPHSYFHFVFTSKPKKKMGKKRIRTFLAQVLQNEGKEELLNYGFEYEIFPHTDVPGLAFRLLPREMFQSLEQSFRGVGLKVVSFHSHIAQYWSILRVQYDLPFAHFHFGENASFFSFHSLKTPYVMRENMFPLSRVNLFDAYKKLSIPDEQLEDTLHNEGLFLGSDSEMHNQVLHNSISTITKFFSHNALGGRMYVSSAGPLPKYLTYLLERHTSAEIIPVCILDFLREKKLLDGILHIHKEKDYHFVPLILRAFHLKKN